LIVWQKAMDLAETEIDTSENLNASGRHYRQAEQPEPSSAPAARNIAEGKGTRSKREFKQYLYIVRRSLYENVALINLFAESKMD
jgi:four helix bundle protein